MVSFSSTTSTSHSPQIQVVLITVTAHTNGQSKMSKLQLIDLAGSERLNKSGATGTCLKETGYGNRFSFLNVYFQEP